MYLHVNEDKVECDLTGMRQSFHSVVTLDCILTTSLFSHFVMLQLCDYNCLMIDLILATQNTL